MRSIDVDEQVVTPHGEVCTIKDCCILLCDTVVVPNPGAGAYTDREVIDPAFNAICKGVEKEYGLPAAELVATALFKLPIVYNARLSRAIGRAKFKYEQGVAYPTVIELTGSMDIPADYMHGLLVHEGCHVAHSVLAGPRFAYEPGHGPRWKALMVAAGERPEAKCSDPRLQNIEKEQALYEKRRMRRGGPAVRLHAADFEPGDKVSFVHKGNKILARVIAKQPEQALVELVGDDGTYSSRHVRATVGYGLLSKEQP